MVDLECEKKKILETAPPYAPEGRFEEEYSLRNVQKTPILRLLYQLSLSSVALWDVIFLSPRKKYKLFFKYIYDFNPQHGTLAVAKMYGCCQKLIQ